MPQASPAFLGLTGAVAAGKSEALAAFARHGAATLSSDAVVHELLDTEELREKLVERFGPDVVGENGTDRHRIGALVFGRPDELSWLESVLHPRVGERMVEWRRSLPAETRVAVIEVPLLFETGMDAAFDGTVCVVADDEVRARRAGERGTELLEGRNERQLSQDEKAARATYVIRNDGSLEELDEQVAELVAKLSAPALGAA